MKNSLSGSASDLGSMRERAILEQEEQTLDEAGGAAPSWREVATVWASVQLYGTPKQQLRDGRTTVRTLWRIQIRRRRDICAGMRIRITGAREVRERTYQILAISEDAGQQQFLQCICEEQY